MLRIQKTFPNASHQWKNNSGPVKPERIVTECTHTRDSEERRIMESVFSLPSPRLRVTPRIFFSIARAREKTLRNEMKSSAAVFRLISVSASASCRLEFLIFFSLSQPLFRWWNHKGRAFLFQLRSFFFHELVAPRVHVCAIGTVEKVREMCFSRVCRVHRNGDGWIRLELGVIYGWIKTLLARKAMRLRCYVWEFAVNHGE